MKNLLMIYRIIIALLCVMTVSCSHTFKLSKKQLEVRDSVYWHLPVDEDGNWCRDFDELRDYQEAIEEQRCSAKGFWSSDPNPVIVEYNPDQMSNVIFVITEFIPTKKRKYYFAGKEMSPDSTVFFYHWANSIRFFKDYVLVTQQDVGEPNIPVKRDPYMKYFVRYARVDLPRNPTAVFTQDDYTVVFCYSDRQVVVMTKNPTFLKSNDTSNINSVKEMSDSTLDSLISTLELRHNESIVFPFLRLYGNQKEIPLPVKRRNNFYIIKGNYIVYAYNITDRDYDFFSAMIAKTFAIRVYYPQEFEDYPQGCLIWFPWLRKYYEYNDLDSKPYNKKDPKGWQ